MSLIKEQDNELIKPCNYERIKNNSDEQKMDEINNNLECFVCKNKIIKMSYYLELLSYHCDTLYCEFCIIKLKNKCLQCNKNISDFYDNCDFTLDNKYDYIKEIETNNINLKCYTCKKFIIGSLHKSHSCNNEYCENCIIKLKNNCLNCNEKITSFFEDNISITNDYDLEYKDLVIEHDKLKICSKCNNNIFRPKYIKKTHTCNNEYCENCIIQLKNNCLNCNKTITDFFDEQKNSYDKIKSFYKQKLDIKENNTLTCDICLNDFIKNPNVNIIHPCSFIYCYECIKKVNNTCKICNNKIKQENIPFKGNWQDYSLDFVYKMTNYKHPNIA